MAMIERAIAEGLAERLGTDLERDPYPGLLAGAAAGVFRASMTFWAGSAGTEPLDQLIDRPSRRSPTGCPRMACAVAGITSRAGERPRPGGGRGRQEGHH